MQRAVIDDSRARAGNNWARRRRDFLLRQLFVSFGQLCQHWHDLFHESEEKDSEMAAMLGSATVPGVLRQLPRLSGFIWPQGSEFATLASLLRWQGEKIAAELAMAKICPEDIELGGQDQGQQEKGFEQLLIQAKGKLYDVMLAEAGNPLLLRLLLENPWLPVTLWQKDLADLGAELFPQAPETVYLYAGKSYFNGYWLAQAQAAFEQALALNPDLEEARRRGFIVRGMLRDQEARAKQSI